jgi:hypothetical protein
MSELPGEDGDPPIRPNVWRWLWYAFGGSLPRRHASWVLHDVTAPTWVLRHGARSVVQLAIPIAAALGFLPASLDLRLLTVAAAGLPALQVMMIMTSPMSEGRLIKAGYPAALGARIRSQRAEAAQRSTAQAHRDRVATRAGRPRVNS